MQVKPAAHPDDRLSLCNNCTQSLAHEVAIALTGVYKLSSHCQHIQAAGVLVLVEKRHHRANNCRENVPAGMFKAQQSALVDLQRHPVMG